VARPEVLVLQSFRSQAVPPWIERCIETVRRWALGAGFEHRLLGDEIFASVPSWFSSKLGGSLVAMSDLARIQAILESFSTGDWNTVIWVDADVLIFAPEVPSVPESPTVQLVRELWIEGCADDSYRLEQKVNNSVMVCARGDGELRALLAETLDAIRRVPRPDKLAAGTRMLTRRQAGRPLPLLHCVGCFSPPVLRDLGGGGGPALALLLDACDRPLVAANLCASLAVDEGAEGEVSRAELERSVDVLLGPDNPILRHFA
jgi:hypothetical protein